MHEWISSGVGFFAKSFINNRFSCCVRSGDSVIMDFANASEILSDSLSFMNQSACVATVVCFLLLQFGVMTG